jgi:thiol:disulfide interchange protein
VNATRYFPHFAKDANFAHEHGIDTRRPQVPAAPTWYHDVGLRASLRRAKAENKPLLVDFEADWCNICKRWDYHVYSDQEIAGLLANFVLLKVNVDFNFADDMARFGGEGPPYLVFLDGDGNPLLSFPEIDETGKETGKSIHGLNHFQRPQDFAATLKAALQAYRAR